MTDAPLHATCIAIDGRGVLLLGDSGAGKSDLALRLIDRGAVLVSDDYCRCTPDGGRLIAAAPETIAGRMEVRHIGIVVMPHLAQVPVALAIRLGDKPPRMPDGTDALHIGDIAIPLVLLDAREASAPIKAELALARFGLNAAP